jgi:hypothetical protein
VSCGERSGAGLDAESEERFDCAWALLAATYQAGVVTLHNVVPFPAGGRQEGR